MVTPQDARTSIEDIRSLRHEVADRADCPPAWRIGSGILAGSLCAAQSAPGTVSLPITVLCFASLVVMVLSARKRTGFFINGYRKGRTRRVVIPLLVAVEAIYIASLWLKESQHISWAPLVGGAIIVPVVIFATYRWQDAYRSEFDAGAATLAREKR